MTHPTQSELLNPVLQLFTREGLEGFAEGIRLLVNEAMRLERAAIPVSYTHLTLPTIYSV